MSSRDFFVTSFYTLLITTVLTRPAHPGLDSPPNFVLIFADDLGYGDLGCFGSSTIRTPNIDRLAAEGTRLTDFYVPASVCSPSRAALLTGRYPVRTGLPWPYWVLGPSSHGIGTSEITLAEALGGLGYATACVGKWHLGDLPESLPTRSGFDRYFGVPYSNDMTPTVLMRDETIVENPVDQKTLTQRYTSEAIRFLNDSRDRPFFLYLPHTFPHIPLHVSPAFEGRSLGGLYGDVVEEIDWSVGEILAEVSRLNLETQTLVIFTSDNGPWLEQDSHAGSPGGLRAGKFTAYEGGIRVPFLARWPGRIPARLNVSAPVVSMDLYPTIIGVAGGEVPRDRAIDGKDILNLLTGQSGSGREDLYFYWKEGEIHSVRSGMWKLHFDRSGNPTELYDLAADVGETQDIAAAHSEVVNRLATKARGFHQEGFRDTALNGVTLVNYLEGALESVVLTRAVVGEKYYTDREDTLVSIPAAFQAGVLVKTASADSSHAGTEFLVLSLIEDATVLVGYDATATALPAWLTGWTATGDVVRGSESGNGQDVDFAVYVRDFLAWDTVTLGGNQQNGGDGGRQYITIVGATSNRAPVARDGSAQVQAGADVEVVLQAADADGDAVSYAIVDPPSNGALSGHVDGNALVTYSPDGGFEGTDSFTFTASDGLLASTVATITVHVQVLTDPSLLAHWQLDEGKGSTTRDTVSGTAGNLIDGPLWSTSVPANLPFEDPHSLDLDGSRAMVDTGMDDLLELTGSMTLCLWLNRRSDSATGHLVSKNSHPNECPWQLAVIATTNGLRYYSNGSQLELIDSADSVPEGWHHVALVRDAVQRQLTFYIDAIPDSGGWRSYASNSVAASAVTVKIGVRGDGQSNWFDGWIDDVRIYGRALSGDEIAQRASVKFFRRGDVNSDGTADIIDAVIILFFLFAEGAEPSCVDAADSNDSGVVDVTDSLDLLNFLFLSAPAPPLPGLSGCGPDPTADRLHCRDPTPCE